MNVSSCIDIIFYVIVKEVDEIYHIGRNERSEFITILQCLHVLEYKSGRRENFSRYHNFLLESENYAMKIFNLFSVIDVQGG